MSRSSDCFSFMFRVRLYSLRIATRHFKEAVAIKVLPNSLLQCD